MENNLKILTVVALFFFLVSCKKKEIGIVAPSLPNLLQITANDPDLKLFNQASQLSGIATVLTSQTPSTVFAPVNSAFRDFLGVTTDEAALQALQGMNPDTLSGLLKYHLLAAKARSEDLPVNGVINSLANGGLSNGGRLFVRRFQAGIHINNASVLQGDIDASNGELHKIDRFLLQPKKTLYSLLQGNPNFMVIKALLDKANLQGSFSGPGPFTLFAPTDDAFLKYYSFLPLKEKAQQQGISLKQALVDTILGFSSRQVGNYLTPILQAHVLAKNQLAYTNDLPTDGTQLATQNLFAPLSSLKGTTGWEVYSKAGSTPSRITNPDVMANNGVLQFIDQVLEVPLTVAQIATQDPQLSIFNAMIPNTNVSNKLNGLGTYTVFAPINSALHPIFDPLIKYAVNGGYLSSTFWPDYLAPADTTVVNFLGIWGSLPPKGSPLPAFPYPDLDAIVQYLVVNDSTVTSSATFPDAGPLYTLAGTPPLSDPNFPLGSVNGRIFIHKSSGVIRVNNNTRILQADIKAANGVLDKTDSIPQQPIYALNKPASQVPSLNIWNTLIEKVGLTSLLSNYGPYTVLAPNDNAFNQYFNASSTFQTNVLIEALTADQLQNTILPLLKSHILANNVLLYTSDLSAGSSYPTLSSGVSVTFNGTVNNLIVVHGSISAKVVNQDSQFSNGIVDVIDRVIQ